MINKSGFNYFITAGVDYRAVSQIVRFAAGQSQVNINIPIKDDYVALESKINFTVTIIPLGDAIFLSDYPIVTIVDDDVGKL